MILMLSVLIWVHWIYELLLLQIQWLDSLNVTSQLFHILLSIESWNIYWGLSFYGVLEIAGVAILFCVRVKIFWCDSAVEAWWKIFLFFNVRAEALSAYATRCAIPRVRLRLRVSLRGLCLSCIILILTFFGNWRRNQFIALILFNWAQILVARWLSGRNLLYRINLRLFLGNFATLPRRWLVRTLLIKDGRRVWLFRSSLICIVGQILCFALAWYWSAYVALRFDLSLL